MQARPAFGEWLRRLRVEAGLSQLALAQKVGFSQSFVSQLETGDRVPQAPEHVEALAKALALPRPREEALFHAAGFLPPNVDPNDEALPTPRNRSLSSGSEALQRRKIVRNKRPNPFRKILVITRVLTAVLMVAVISTALLIGHLNSFGVALATLGLSIATMLTSLDWFMTSSRVIVLIALGALLWGGFIATTFTIDSEAKDGEPRALMVTWNSCGDDPLTQ